MSLIWGPAGRQKKPPAAGLSATRCSLGPAGSPDKPALATIPGPGGKRDEVTGTRSRCLFLPKSYLCAKSPRMSQPILQLDNAQIYQRSKKVLMNVHLTIHPGEFTYLIGKTGSGKSSLLKTLYGALPLRDGTGAVAGYDLSALTRRTIPALRRQLGIVFQDFNLLTDRTAGENLLFVLRATGHRDKAQMQQRTLNMLQSVGLADKLDKMPYELSGGEQQRIGIARALLNDPVLILADEPTGNLDPETSDDIIMLLRRLAKERNTAVLFATHDYRTLEQFPARIIRCHGGRVLNEKELEIE